MLSAGLALAPEFPFCGLIPTVLGFSFPLMRFTSLFQEGTSVAHSLDYWETVGEPGQDSFVFPLLSWIQERETALALRSW